MRVLSLATVAIVFVIAACSDVAAPIATGPDAASPTVGGAAHFLGGKKADARGKHGRDDDRQECNDDDDRGGKPGHHARHSKGRGRHDHHWGTRGWGKHGHHDDRRGKHGHKEHHRGKGGHDHDDQGSGECGGGGGGGGGGEGTTATISGTVMAQGFGANGFPVFLLDAGGTVLVATTTTTTDGTGSYSFEGVRPGTYLVCEDDPFTEAHGFLGETTPTDGPTCPAAYAPVGYSVTVAGGATAGGNDFANFNLE